MKIDREAIAEKLGIPNDIFSPVTKEDFMEWAKSTEIDPRIIKFLKEPMGEGKQHTLHVVTRHRRRTYL
tara:strand:- start:1754 stop:1960 length:207 start_codon:yes stop_codon:yes gene_type:complete